MFLLNCVFVSLSNDLRQLINSFQFHHRAADLFIFYYVSPKFGEEWTQYDYIQIAGIAVLVYGTAVYNAPNKGGLRLRGQVWAFGFDCSEEYGKIKEGEGNDDDNSMEELLLS